MTDIATTASPARSIVFIDARVQDAATLLQALDAIKQSDPRRCPLIVTTCADLQHP